MNRKEILKELTEKESEYLREKSRLDKKLEGLSGVGKKEERLNKILRANSLAEKKIKLKIASAFSNNPKDFIEGASHKLKPAIYKKEDALKIRGGYRGASSIAWKYFWELCKQNKSYLRIEKENTKIVAKISSIHKRKELEKVRYKLRSLITCLSFTKEQIGEAKNNKGFLIQWGKEKSRNERVRKENIEKEKQGEALEKFIREFVNKGLK